VSTDVQIGLVDSDQSKQARLANPAYNWRSFITARGLNIRNVARRALETIPTFPLLERAQFWLKLRRLQKDRSHVHDRYGMEHETFRQKLGVR
jgi:hypothetical protein